MKMMIRGKNFILVVVLIMCLALSTQVCSQEQVKDWPKYVSIGSGSYGGGMFMAASAVAAALQKELPDLNVTVEVTGAAVENSRLVQGQEVEIGLITTEVSWDAYYGEGTFKDLGAHSDLRTIFPGYSSVKIIVTNSIYGFERFEDLDGKLISPGTPNSANEVFTLRAIEAAGIKPAGLQAMPTPDASAALQSQQIHAYTVGFPNATTSELDISNPGLVQILFLEGDTLERFLEMFPQYFYPMTLPAGSLSCITEDVIHLGEYISFFTYKDAPEDFIYEIVKAVYENREKVIKNSYMPFYNGMDVANVDKTFIPYHKGAVKYFNEIGVDIPDELIPPEM